jgi:RsiW-degrading membrane proteinase PrsW (M82 family)
MEAMYLVFFFLAVSVAVLWVCEFVQLMALGDRDFPGQHDKVLWVVAFLVGNVLGAIAFHYWRLLPERFRKGTPPGRQDGITELPHR